MKVFLDTNVIMDLLEKREPFVKDAAYIFQLQHDGMIEILISDLTFINLAYITRKSFSNLQLYEVLQKIRPFFGVCSIGESIIDEALLLQARDFEDAVQYLTAKKNNVSYIITRNKKDYPYKDISIVTPSEFLAIFKRLS